jgi:hypothetical protein
MRPSPPIKLAALFGMLLALIVVPAVAGIARGASG